MNTKIVLASFAAALSGLAGFANSAHAGTDFRINLNLGVPRPPVVVVANHHEGSGYGYGYATPAPAPRGYWKDVVVKVWVPERWVVSYDRRGREIRRCEPGYYTYRNDRVWVDYGHDHNGYGYGYTRNDNCR